jgi:TonB family protein
MAQLQRIIKKHWFPPHGQNSKRVVVSFTVAPDGTVSAMQLMHSAGTSIEDNAALEAIRSSHPLPPLPEGAHEPVQIEFTFDYNVLTGGGGSWHHI